MSDTLEETPTPATRVQRRSRSKLVAVVVVVAILAVVGGVVLATRGKGPLAGVIPGTSKSPERVTPAFSFKGSKAQAIPTLATQSAKKLKGAAGAAAKQTTAVMDTLYTEAFLDPANWTDGSYDSAIALFDAGAKTQATKDVASLTAGANAGDTYDDIQPGRGTVSSQVLMDSKGNPVSVVAKVNFTAKGTNKDGTITLFVSQGQYFLRRVDGDWKVVAFDVHRDDKVKKPEPSPTTSAPGSSAGSPS